MRFTLNHFWQQKRGNEAADYEDAFAPKVNGTFDWKSLALALADGATESSFASAWAKMLTRSFVKEPFTSIEALQNRTQELSKRWWSFVNRKTLPWYAEEKARLGAYATFLGLQFSSEPNATNESGLWSAIAIGDSCLFQVRNNNLIYSFPISDTVEFGNSPTLLSSTLARNSKIWEKVKFHAAEWNAGDIFLLATDALACWFLSEHERNGRPWNILLSITEDPAPDESFLNWADNLRRSSRLKNDDITLLIVRL